MDNSTRIAVKRRNISVKRDVLEKLTKEELIEKIIQIDAHNTQLKSILLKNLGDESEDIEHQKKFDFSKINKRHVLLKFLYLGWDYQGYAVQEESNTTIEYHLFKALKRTCLIEKRENSNYHRCGRTDKGVSAFEQTVSIDLRSSFPAGPEQLDPDNIAKEMNYCHMLNRNLPRDIRCVAWMPVKSPSYSARFDCKERLYRYFFPRGNLNIEAMKEACRTLIGAHDFRNLCKMDVGNGVVKFIRNIYNAEIHQIDNNIETSSDYDMFYIEIHGRSFLWHQIRCLMTILLLIGEEKEAPSVLAQLFDVENNPCKPQYHLASEIPLNLYWVNYAKKSANFYGNEQDDVDEDMKIDDNADDESDLTEWVYDKKDLANVIQDLQGHWTQNSVKTCMIREMLKDLMKLGGLSSEKISNQAHVLVNDIKHTNYKPLMHRSKCKSLKDRIDHYVTSGRIQYVKKQKLDVEVPSSSTE